MNDQVEDAAAGGERPGKTAGHGRRTLLMIFLVGFVPVIAAMISYFSGIGIPAQRSNHGELLLPVQTLAAGELRTATGDRPLAFGTDQPWRLMIVPVDDCVTQACLGHLDLLRRLQVAMARHADRLQRCLLASGLATSRQALLEQRFPGQQLVAEQGQRLAGLVLADGSGLPTLLVVDPLGNIVLRYPGSQNPRDVIEDLKKMLKVSRIG